ncbi:MAG TPA: hypothetical protein VFQ67_00495 [Allosphingosinicella sp.]|jgi:hypothetical protein|nr:hypothetical protein [Allosphingosinicella sp.]
MRFVLCLAGLLLAACSDPIPETIGGAMQAYGRNRVGEAEAIYRKIAADPGASARDKATAHRQLGRIAWLVDGDSSRALTEVEAAFAASDDRCASGRLKARILQEGKRGEALLSQLEALAALCEDRGPSNDIRLRGVAAALDLAAAGKTEALATAARLIAGGGEEGRSAPVVSGMTLQIALLQGDSAGALQAWRDYFWLNGSDVPQGLASAYPAATTVFALGLASDASPAAQLNLVDLLVRAGFAEPAERFARAKGLLRSAGQDPLWRKASAYFEARRALQAAVLDSNRRTARGGDAADMPALLTGFEDRLMAGAGLSGDRREGLLKAYSLYGQSQKTDGYGGIHLGHAIERVRWPVEQYGHRAQVSFIALDNMVANGFMSWLWDGSAATGGWTEEGPVIVQVRSEYTSSPLAAWALFSGGPARTRLIEELKRDEASDLTALAGGGVRYLPGLAGRIQLQVADQIGRRARAGLAPGGDLRRAFLAEYWRGSFQDQMLVHEGRHALDKKLVRGLARLNDSNLEYRAKLSELALADYPRLALININAPEIGSGSAHGKADERLLGAYAEWMRGHSAEIAGYDPRRPALAQLDRLSDAQLRLVARGLDPVAK